MEQLVKMTSHERKKKRILTNLKQPDPAPVQQISERKGLSKYRLGMIALAFIVILFAMILGLIFGPY